jgi:hypothetical protein
MALKRPVGLTASAGNDRVDVWQVQCLAGERSSYSGNLIGEAGF